MKRLVYFLAATVLVSRAAIRFTSAQATTPGANLHALVKSHLPSCTAGGFITAIGLPKTIQDSDAATFAASALDVNPKFESVQEGPYPKSVR
jgi:hypothetical protein